MWNFTVNEVEVNRQLLKRKHSVNTVLQDKSSKRQKLESEVKTLRRTTKSQAKVISRLKTGRLEHSRGSSSKSWGDYSRQSSTIRRRI